MATWTVSLVCYECGAVWTADARWESGKLAYQRDGDCCPECGVLSTEPADGRRECDVCEKLLPVNVLERCGDCFCDVCPGCRAAHRACTYCEISPCTWTGPDACPHSTVCKGAAALAA